MFKTLAALFLASLLAVMAYGLFWMVCIDYTATQMQEAVREAVGADISHGSPQWVPDVAHVTMDLPSAKLVMAHGPVREVRASNLRVLSSFLMRDRWTVQLPERVEVVLANGKVLLLEAQGGEISWLREGGMLNLRAEKIALIGLDGRELLQLDDVVLGRKSSDLNVRVNLASRPKVTGGTGQLSGQMTMPAPVFSSVVNLFGKENLPTLGVVFGTISEGLKRGGTLKMENISFKMPGGISGALYGDMRVLADGRALGHVVVTSDDPRRTMAWIAKAGLVQPRNEAERRGEMRFRSGIDRARGTVRMENMQETLMLNGHPVGPLPVVGHVVRRLWK
ncbi:MAG: hypothetical protein EON60_09045 [Alphaproteobacteria bacterium]|nr:MAG: hypothetical protein EON60_09045 [Alphaproteobacteria bacterium]